MMEATPKQNKFLAFVDKYYWWLFAAGVLLVVWLSFFMLGLAPVYLWDEARHGVNAFEMLQQNNFIANFYNGTPDYWNLKPPLSYWIIMLGYKIFGYNVWGLRFFSALAYVFLAILAALFLKHHFGKLPSLILLVMFAGNYVLLIHHCVRRGDADAIFLLFIGIAMMALYNSQNNPNWLHVTGLGLALAFLSKSYHALILLPIIFFYLLWTKGFRKIKWWQYFTVTLVTILPVAAWLIARVTYDGWAFIRAMWEVDVMARSGEVLEAHAGFPFFYTINTLYNVVVLLAVILLIIKVVRNIKNKTQFTNLEKLALISVIVIFGLYAIPRTKLNWYVYPAYFPLLLFGAVEIANIFHSTTLSLKARRGILITIAVVLGLSVVASQVTIVTSLDPRNRPIELHMVLERLDTQDTTANYYYQNGTDTQLDQAALLVFEWRTKKLVRDGGVAAFNADTQAYLIVNKQNLSNASMPNDAIKLDESVSYVVYYRGS